MYTYVKTNIRRDDGRVDITALRSRYENAAMQDLHINEVKKTLANISYHNKQAMKFETFVATFQKAIDDLDMYGCGMHNGDIVDLLWIKMGNPELATYVVFMKFHYQVFRRGYREILQYITTQILFLAPKSFRARVSDLHQTDITAEEVGCLEQGARTSTGKLFTCTYPYKKWIHEYVLPYHEAILSSRVTTKKKNDSPFQKHHQTQKRKAAELRSILFELNFKKSRMISEISVITDDSSGGVSLGRSTDLSPTQAGRQFGCRSKKIDGKNK